ncbi:hypothetical protein B7R54_14990 [Subtercola boreus]|uniref:Alpha-galactosidase NEW3 domain-containing protein n=1 Tax=Subtercola boreus TaxID=120213 RepID=A0A3E0VN99_9MICO|nr:hypothetical protein [Subtercola boreus]RFA10367.1 hypothetical protein B7R54_14990 [Subtercola boreus]TQL56120.1 hypothetical protein FB464_3705 [Subtercola boreus]
MTTRRARGGALAACTLVALLLALVGTASPALADTATPAATPTPTPSPTQTTTYNTLPTPFSLTVSPTRLALGPADAGTDHAINVVNRGEDALHIDVQKQSFVGAADGSLAFQADAPYSAIDWVSVSPASFDVQPGAAQSVSVSVDVPANADLGDHQVALVFLVPAGTDGSNIKINRGVGTPVYITVPGPVDDTVTVSDLAAPGFSAGGPVDVTASVQNAGTVHRDFRGDSALALAGASTDFTDFTVARGSARTISATWTPPLMCICNISTAITNADGVSTSESVQVIVFPVVPAAELVGGLLLVVLLLVFARHQYRKGVRLAAERLTSDSSGDV